MVSYLRSNANAKCLIISFSTFLSVVVITFLLRPSTSLLAPQTPQTSYLSFCPLFHTASTAYQVSMFPFSKILLFSTPRMALVVLLLPIQQHL